MLKQPSVWQALNEPVVEVPEGLARGLLKFSVVVLLAAWVVPYWGLAAASLPDVAYDSPLISAYGGRIAGAQTAAVPEWYEVSRSLPGEVMNAYAAAAAEVLDVSAAVSPMVEFYEPGAQAVSDAWLELMADPY